MTRKIWACGHIAAGFALVFAGAISATQAQQLESERPIVTVEDCGKSPIFICASTGQRLGGAPRRMHANPYRHARHLYPSYDQPTRDRERLWYDP